VGGVIRMLSDWEIRRLAEIEQGLAEDFPPSALRRLLSRQWVRRIWPWAVLGLVLDGVLIALVLSAWLVAVICTVAGEGKSAGAA